MAMDELRERCAEAYYNLRWLDGQWATNDLVHKGAYYEVVDAILAEIAAAGYVVVKADRLDPILEAGE